MTTATAYTFRDTITTMDELREVVSMPNAASVAKSIDVIDEHAASLIAKATFLLLGTSGAAGTCDVSPKGDVAGFVKVLDEHTLVIPDRPGNHRLDSLTNIIENPHVGLLFIVPGVEWTLRVNGRASIVRDADVLARCTVDGKTPQLAIGVEVEELYLHCPKCFLRSKLWETDSWMPENEQPNFAAILKDQVKMLDKVPVGVIEQALKADEEKLY